jgi:thioredoxin 1
MDGWASGLCQLFAKEPYLNRYRGFESPAIRQNKPGEQMLQKKTASLSAMPPNDGSHLVMFSSKSCQPCIRTEAVLLNLSQSECSGKTVVILDVETHHDLARSFNVRSVPSLFLVKDGCVIDSKVGTPTRTTLLKWLKTIAA